MFKLINPENYKDETFLNSDPLSSCLDSSYSLCATCDGLLNCQLAVAHYKIGVPVNFIFFLMDSVM